MSTKKNIVLDIDATLVHTHGEIDDFSMLNIYSDSEKLEYRRKLYTMTLFDSSPDTPPGTGSSLRLSGIYRPYLKEFLDFCSEYFDNVVIWSAGQKKYVEKMAEIMYPFREYQPLVIYNWDDCVHGEGDYLKKPLAKLFKDKRVKGKMNEKNTFVLDDRDDTFSFNPKNGIQIPEFESDMSIDDIVDHPDDSFIKLMAWLSLKEVKECKDIRKLNKRNIFKRGIEDYNKQLKAEKKD